MVWPQHDPNIPKPKLRGLFHVVGALLMLPATYILFDHSAPGTASFGALIYGGSLALLLGVSGTYHTIIWTKRMRLHMRRLDRSMIFVLVGGTMTPFLLVLDGHVPSFMFEAVWSGAFAGVAMSVLWPRAPRIVASMSYIIFGFLCLPLLPAVYEVLGSEPVVLIIVGGVVYIVGAVAYIRRAPDFVPHVFGYHELFHVLVLVASGCHYAAIWKTVA